MRNQLFLLNFYKVLSNIATKLVGAFIPVIILEATGLVWLACLSVSLQFLVRMLCSIACKKFYEKCPQIILLFRLIPVVLYSLSIYLIDTNLWLGVIGVILFYGINESFKNMPIEIIFNYASTKEETGSALGLTRLLEQVGVLVALVVGGLMLDVNRNLILFISISLYVISVVPLVIYFVRSRKEKGFNADATSNAVIAYSKDPELQQNASRIAKKMLLGYAVVYFLFSFIDVIGSAFVIHIYLSASSYGLTGYMSALYNAMFGIGCFLFGKLDSKKETTPVVIVSCLICAVLSVLLIVVKSIPLLFVLMGLTGFAYSSISTFCLSRLLPKSRIMGVANQSLYVREVSVNLSVVVPMVFGVFGSMVPIMIIVAGAIGLSGYIIPANEERSRKLLIQFLQNHENTMSTMKKKKKGEIK